MGVIICVEICADLFGTHGNTVRHVWEAKSYLDRRRWSRQFPPEKKVITHMGSPPPIAMREEEGGTGKLSLTTLELNSLSTGGG